MCCCILMVVVEEFVNGGLFGVCVDQIVCWVEINECMFYYYFGSKEQFFMVVFEYVFFVLIEVECVFDFDGVVLVEVVMWFVYFVWDYYCDYLELFWFINNENLYEVCYLYKLMWICEMMLLIVVKFGNVLMCGQKVGLFCNDVDLLCFYVMLLGFGYYIVLNCFMFVVMFGCDFIDIDECVEMVWMNIEVLFVYLLWC